MMPCATEGRAAVPRSDLAAGAFNDRDERDDIPEVHDRVEHDIGVTGGDEEVAVAIAPGAVEAGHAHQLLEGDAVLVLAYIDEVRIHQHTVTQVARRTDPHQLVV